MRDFLLLCFKRDPKDRPSAEELINHTWLMDEHKVLAETWTKRDASGGRTQNDDAEEGVIVKVIDQMAKVGVNGDVTAADDAAAANSSPLIAASERSSSQKDLENFMKSDLGNFMKSDSGVTKAQIDFNKSLISIVDRLKDAFGTSTSDVAAIDDAEQAGAEFVRAMETATSVLVANETLFTTRACGVFVNVLENESASARMRTVALECVTAASMLSRDILTSFVTLAVLPRALEVLKKKDSSMRIKLAALRLCRATAKSSTLAV